MNLLDYIPTGRENAVTRTELMALTGYPDRTVRKEIERLRTEGVPIISLSDHPGYWMAERVEEIERYLRECDARTRTQSRTNAKLRRLVADEKGEFVVPVRSHLRYLKRHEVDGQLQI